MSPDAVDWLLDTIWMLRDDFAARYKLSAAERPAINLDIHPVFDKQRKPAHGNDLIYLLLHKKPVTAQVEDSVPTIGQTAAEASKDDQVSAPPAGALGSTRENKYQQKLRAPGFSRPLSFNRGGAGPSAGL